MANSSPTMRAAWRSPKGHIGQYRPAQLVEVRRGVMDKLYQPFTFLNGTKEKFGTIAKGEHNSAPWQGEWRPTGDWAELPNVQVVDMQQSFDANGVRTATISVENIVAVEWAGLVGTLHLIRRGYLSPLYGWAMAGRAKSRLAYVTNEWLNVLNGGYQVRVKQGFGTNLSPRFVGLIDDTDITIDPDVITITCRDFGQMLTDQRVFGWNKAREIKPPVIFADRRRSMNVKKVGSAAAASSTAGGHPASAVQRQGHADFWQSQGHDDDGVTEWVEIHLPAGTYEDFWLWPKYSGMELYISVYARGAKVDGAPVADGWINRSSGDMVPGANGGHTYVKHLNAVANTGYMRKLGFSLECGNGTVIRCSFRRLQFDKSTRDYRAGVNRMVAYRLEGLKKEAKIKHWILIDDASEIVKWVFMWAGFHEWEVEDFGTSIVDPMPFHQTTFLIDIVSHMEEQGDFHFFMGGPSDHPDSIGVPIFRSSRAVNPGQATVEEVRDTDLLTGVEPKFTKEPLSYIIRVRGKSVPKGKGGKALGEDSSKRHQGVYLPPWSGAHHSVLSGHYTPGFPDRLSGVRKHVVHTDTKMTSNDACQKMAVLIAIQEALGWATCVVEIPGDPGFGLDEHLSVIDTTTGMNSRLWLASIHSTFTAGQTVEWKVDLGGSFIDTPDMVALQHDHKALRDRVLNEAP